MCTVACISISATKIVLQTIWLKVCGQLTITSYHSSSHNAVITTFIFLERFSTSLTLKI